MIRFDEMTTEQATAAASGSTPIVLLLPVGAIEPHGPHAALATDVILASAICERTATALEGDESLRALVLPALPYGVTRCAAAFAGAVGIDAEALRAVVVGICRSLREQGFRRVAIVNHHFEPAHVAALRQAVEELGGEGAGTGLLDLTRRRLAQRLTEEFRRGSCHAGSYETSLLLAQRPDLVDRRRARALAPLDVDMPGELAAGRDDFESMGMSEAYCGAPADASVAEGEASYETLIEMAIELVRRLVAAS